VTYTIRYTYGAVVILARTVDTKIHTHGSEAVFIRNFRMGEVTFRGSGSNAALCSCMIVPIQLRLTGMSERTAEQIKKPLSI
jgi:hypothetical protein